MPISIQVARSSLPGMWWMVGGMNIIVLAVFLFGTFESGFETAYIFGLLAIIGLIGLVAGSYYTFRSSCGVDASLCYLLYVVIALEYFFGNGAAAAAVQIAGRPDLIWIAILVNSLTMLVTLMYGIHIEIKNFRPLNKLTGMYSLERFEKYINYPLRQIRPEVIVNTATTNNTWRSPVFLVAVGSANIPLLFDLYGGGRFNAIFLAIPMVSGACAYINVKGFGPSLLHLYLLQKLENSLGYRFINADYEQIQELRRTFFLSRWLMKDYIKPTSKAAASNDAVQRK